MSQIKGNVEQLKKNIEGKIFARKKFTVYDIAIEYAPKNQSKEFYYFYGVVQRVVFVLLENKKIYFVGEEKAKAGGQMKKVYGVVKK